ncbi:MAG: hypothetical protein NXY57DRAFT_1043846 [Lentinula lateritia]|nr:MAG: hypothetical protein NXY57DRAFT_1043846 [Lentinula lateritia]
MPQRLQPIIPTLARELLVEPSSTFIGKRKRTPDDNTEGTQDNVDDPGDHEGKDGPKLSAPDTKRVKIWDGKSLNCGLPSSVPTQGILSRTHIDAGVRISQVNPSLDLNMSTVPPEASILPDSNLPMIVVESSQLVSGVEFQAAFPSQDIPPDSMQRQRPIPDVVDLVRSSPVASSSNGSTHSITLDSINKYESFESIPVTDSTCPNPTQNVSYVAPAISLDHMASASVYPYPEVDIVSKSSFRTVLGEQLNPNSEEIGEDNNGQVEECAPLRESIIDNAMEEEQMEEQEKHNGGITHMETSNRLTIFEDNPSIPNQIRELEGDDNEDNEHEESEKSDEDEDNEDEREDEGNKAFVGNAMSIACSTIDLEEEEVTCPRSCEYEIADFDSDMNPVEFDYDYHYSGDYSQSPNGTAAEMINGFLDTVVSEEDEDNEDNEEEEEDNKEDEEDNEEDNEEDEEDEEDNEEDNEEEEDNEDNEDEEEDRDDDTSGTGMDQMLARGPITVAFEEKDETESCTYEEAFQHHAFVEDHEMDGEEYADEEEKENYVEDYNMGGEDQFAEAQEEEGDNVEHYNMVGEEYAEEEEDYVKDHEMSGEDQYAEEEEEEEEKEEEEEEDQYAEEEEEEEEGEQGEQQEEEERCRPEEASQCPAYVEDRDYTMDGQDQYADDESEGSDDEDIVMRDESSNIHDTSRKATVEDASEEDDLYPAMHLHSGEEEEEEEEEGEQGEQQEEEERCRPEEASQRPAYVEDRDYTMDGQDQYADDESEDSDDEDIVMRDESSNIHDTSRKATVEDASEEDDLYPAMHSHSGEQWDTASFFSTSPPKMPFETTYVEIDEEVGSKVDNIVDNPDQETVLWMRDEIQELIRTQIRTKEMLSIL